MTFVKCPRCELNYIWDDQSLCTVCRKEVRGESEQDEIAELCSECGENPVVPGGELCAACLKELSRMKSGNDEDDVDQLPDDNPNLEIDSVATMDEIAIDINEPMGDFVGDVDDADFKDDDDDDDDEDDDDGKPGKKA